MEDASPASPSQQADLSAAAPTAAAKWNRMAGQTREVRSCQRVAASKPCRNGAIPVSKLNQPFCDRIPFAPLMSFLSGPSLGTLLGAALLLLAGLPAFAQSGEQKPQDQKTPPADLAKEQKKIDEFAEAIRVLGGPASNPECVWLGRRVVNNMWRDDLDTAFRHLDLYDRFGCPGGHIQAAFRCLVRQGPFDPKALETLSARVHACWINPTMDPAQNSPPAQASQPSGTKAQ